MFYTAFETIIDYHVRQGSCFTRRWTK